MKRCIVNVASDRYMPLQERMARSLAAAGWQGGLLAWRNALPPGSPAHREVPYAFKLYAIREALRRGHTSVLWLDAPCTAARPLGPVFDRIEREGHLFVAGNDRLGNWASDACLASFGLSRDEAMRLPLMNGTFVGLDLSNARSHAWLDELFRRCEAGLFHGPYFSTHAPAAVRARKPGKSEGFVSRDPRCWGHRHDEAVGSCLARQMGMAMSPAGDLYANGTPGASPSAIIRSLQP